MNEQSNTAVDAYQGWAIVELMGHRITAGRVSEVTQFGVSQIRVDVPGIGDAVAVTQFYGGGAIYSLTPCDEAAARRALEQRYSLPEPVLLALAPPDHDEPVDEDGMYDELEP